MNTSKGLVYEMLTQKLKEQSDKPLKEEKESSSIKKSLLDLNSEDILQGIILSEVLGKPVSKRNRDRDRRRKP